jgi:hypothetical protein
MTAQEIIARELCNLSEIDPDAASEAGEPNMARMNRYALEIVLALFNAGFDIVSADADEEVED